MQGGDKLRENDGRCVRNRRGKDGRKGIRNAKMLRREKRGKVGFQYRWEPNVSDGFKKSIKQLESDCVKKKKKAHLQNLTPRAATLLWGFFF